MRKILLHLVLFFLPWIPAEASNVNLIIEGPADGKVTFDSWNQNRLHLKVITDRSDDPNRDKPSLKLSIDNLDEATMKDVVDCNLRSDGGNYYETFGASKVIYNFLCNFTFQDKVQFDSNNLKLRIVVTYLSKVSFVDSEIELIGSAISPTYVVEKIQFSSDGKFQFQAVTRLMNLKSPAGDVNFQICIDNLGCENANASSKGIIEYSRTITNQNYNWLIVRISATANNGAVALNPLTQTIYRDKSAAPNPIPTPSNSRSSSSERRSQGSESQLKPERKTNLRSFVKVPVNAKLGVPFPVTISVKGSGVASCYFAVYSSTNGWGSYNTTGGTTSKRFQIKGGNTVTTNGVMSVNRKGPWGVILYCNDAKTRAGLPIVVGRIIQN